MWDEFDDKTPIFECRGTNLMIKRPILVLTGEVRDELFVYLPCMRGRRLIAAFLVLDVLLKIIGNFVIVYFFCTFIVNKISNVFK